MYEKVAEHYHRSPNPKVRVGKIDGTAHPGLAAPFDIKGYPTVLLLRNGELVADFQGPRTFDGLVAFVDNALDEPSSSAAPAAPRVGGSSSSSSGGGGGARKAGRGSSPGEPLSAKITRMAKSLSETDPLTAALGMLGVALTGAVGLVLLLCLTTAATPQRGGTPR